MENELAVTPEQQDIIRVNGYEQRALALVISNHSDAQLAASINIDLAKRIDMVTAVYKDLCEPAKMIVEKAKKYCDPSLKDMENARNITKTKLVEWDAKERKRLADERELKEAEERKIRQAAEKAQAELQAKAKVQADALAAKASEARRQLEAAQAAGNVAAAQKAAKEQANAEAAESRAMENAQAKMQQIQAAAAAQISAQEPVEEQAKIVGSAMRDKWVAEMDPRYNESSARMLIIKAAASDSPELAGLLSIDMKALNKLATALQGSMFVPAFKAVNRPIAVGARK